MSTAPESAGPGCVIRTLRPEDWQAYRAIRLRALLEAPDAFCSTLAREEVLAPHIWAARTVNRPSP